MHIQFSIYSFLFTNFKNKLYETKFNKWYNSSYFFEDVSLQIGLNGDLSRFLIFKFKAIGAII